jgi:rubrerythrin
MTQLSKEIIDKIRVLQTNEITEYVVYSHLAKRLKDEHNKNILLKIGEDELAHANIWKSYTNEDIKPKRLTILFYDILNDFWDTSMREPSVVYEFVHQLHKRVLMRIERESYLPRYKPKIW